MATVPFDFMSLPTDVISNADAECTSETPDVHHEPPRRMHRIHTVRLRQGVSLRTAARQMGSTIRSLRKQEDETADLKLSELHEWQKALDVPICELLEEPDHSTLSPPVLQRARMLRMMKTAQSLLENASEPAMQRLAENLVNQILEIMPELKDVAPWHTYGQRRSVDEVGRAAAQPIPLSVLTGETWD